MAYKYGAMNVTWGWIDDKEWRMSSRMKWQQDNLFWQTLQGCMFL